MFFKRKKLRVLERGMLAEAITIYSDKIKLEEMKYYRTNWLQRDIIKLNKHLAIKIDSVWCSYDAPEYFQEIFLFIKDIYFLEISIYR